MRMQEQPPAPARTLRILERARALIMDPKHWTYGTLARNADGRPIGIDSPGAVRFCAVGAIQRATLDVGEEGTQAIYAAKRAQAVVNSKVDGNIVRINDDPVFANAEGKTRREAVIDVFGEAIDELAGRINEEEA
jgi:hypothetical protein